MPADGVRSETGRFQREIHCRPRILRAQCSILAPKSFELKFAILHHSACCGSLFHYRVDQAGATTSELAETQPGEHRKSIAIVLEGDFDAQTPTTEQVAALNALLLQLKKRYPDIEIGGHRQVRGDDTSCPGDQFPLAAIRQWAKSELIAQRDATMQAEVDRQYYRH